MERENTGTPAERIFAHMAYRDTPQTMGTDGDSHANSDTLTKCPKALKILGEHNPHLS